MLKGDRLLGGANFASAGVGILNDTGFQFVRNFVWCNFSINLNFWLDVINLIKNLGLQLNIIHIGKQLEYFEQYQMRVSQLIGAEGTRQLVNDALVLITLGGNDFVNNYYLVPYSARSRQFSLPDYVRYLISEYRKILQVIIINSFFFQYVTTCALSKSLFVLRLRILNLEHHSYQIRNLTNLVRVTPSLNFFFSSNNAL